MAYDTLAGMKQRGLHVSPQDDCFLAQLRAKAKSPFIAPRDEREASAALLRARKGEAPAGRRAGNDVVWQ